MCVGEIVLYPHKILCAKTQDIEDFDDENFLNLVKQLKASMDAYSHCVGLAANQIGSNLNVFIADASKNSKCNSQHREIILVNAKIIDRSGSHIMREGCMSIPDLTGDVNRYTNIKVSGHNTSGDYVEYEAADFEARVLQHEIDHLNGKVFLDRVKSSRDVFVRKHYRK